MGCSDEILDIRLEVDCDSNFSGTGCDSGSDSDVVETTIPSYGFDGEPDIDVADMKIRLELDSDDACLILAVSNMPTFCLEGNFSNGELPPRKTASLKRDKDT
jgi:hypothetical protein